MENKTFKVGLKFENAIKYFEFLITLQASDNKSVCVCLYVCVSVCVCVCLNVWVCLYVCLYARVYLYRLYKRFRNVTIRNIIFEI